MEVVVASADGLLPGTEVGAGLGVRTVFGASGETGVGAGVTTGIGPGVGLETGVGAGVGVETGIGVGTGIGVDVALGIISRGAVDGSSFL